MKAQQFVALEFDENEVKTLQKAQEILGDWCLQYEGIQEKTEEEELQVKFLNEQSHINMYEKIIDIIDELNYVIFNFNDFYE